jgi:hypothetical protein
VYLPPFEPRQKPKKLENTITGGSDFHTRSASYREILSASNDILQLQRSNELGEQSFLIVISLKKERAKGMKLM